ncbi:hypothetical protein AGMMS50256_21530 [Betaproteobacteria bacterium]|nr:hypothetical protein AGMMS50256_21530 [Betaproteobacteria bacterium]
MSTNPYTFRHRGQYRFWDPIDYRYKYYSWPKAILAKCRRCSSCVRFQAVVPDSYAQDPQSGGYQVVMMSVPTEIHGHGVCEKCGGLVNSISWPRDAYFYVSVRGGDVWAWNEQYVQVLQARVGGDCVRERQLCLKGSFLYRYFLSRLPKHVVAKANRQRILHALDQLLSKSRISLRSAGPLTATDELKP